MRKKAIKHKKTIVNSYPDPIWNYKYDGQYSKGKIHCSCSLCRSRGISVSDKRKLLAMESSLIDYYNDDSSSDNPLNYESFKSKLKKDTNKYYYGKSNNLPGTRLGSESMDYAKWNDYLRHVQVQKQFYDLYNKCYSNYINDPNEFKPFVESDPKILLWLVFVKYVNKRKAYSLPPWFDDIEELKDIIRHYPEKSISNLLKYEKA